MKIQKKIAIAFLVSLGFPKASEWDDEKIVTRLSQVPGRITEEAISDTTLVPTLKSLEECKGKGIELVDDSESNDEEKPAKKEKKGEKPEKPEKEEKKDKSDKKDKPEKPEKAATKSDKKDKPAAKSEKAPKKEKKAKAPKVEKEKDSYGSTVGTVRASVNATFSKEWKGDADVAKEAGVTLRQARIRLRKAVGAGILEKQRLIQYRIAPEKKKAAKK